MTNARIDANLLRVSAVKSRGWRGVTNGEGMHGRAWGPLVLAAGLVGLGPQAWGQESGRPATPPVRIANINLITAGGGYVSYEHPALEMHGYPTIAYSRRVLRRETRHFPLWLRGAFQFLSDDRTFYGYTVWAADEDAFPEEVDEHTSDFTFRGEAVMDFVRLPYTAFYGGAGFLLHTLNFTSDGNVSQIPTFEASLTATSPSFAAGVRVFGETRPYTGYFELRYGRVFGRTDDKQGGKTITDQTFEFVSSNAVFLEAGFGFHW